MAAVRNQPKAVTYDVPDIFVVFSHVVRLNGVPMRKSIRPISRHVSSHWFTIVFVLNCFYTVEITKRQITKDVNGTEQLRSLKSGTGRNCRIVKRRTERVHLLNSAS